VGGEGVEESVQSGKILSLSPGVSSVRRTLIPYLFVYNLLVILRFPVVFFSSCRIGLSHMLKEFYRVVVVNAENMTNTLGHFVTQY